MDDRTITRDRPAAGWTTVDVERADCGVDRRRARVEELTVEVAGLRAAMERRAVIEQAKGVIMATTGCDADAAFELLIAQSQSENRKVRDIAVEIVAAQGRGRGTDG